MSALTDEELGQMVRDTPVFRVAIAARGVDEFMNEIKDDEEVWNRIVTDTLNKHGSRVKNRGTIEKVLLAYHDAVGEYAALAREPEDLADEAVREVAGGADVE